MTVKEQLNVHIRWMLRRDLPDVLAIEDSCFQWDAWTEQDFIRWLRIRNCIGMVSESEDERIVGHMVYTIHESSTRLVNFAVHPDSQRNGVGRQMVDEMKRKLHPERRKRLELNIRESNLDAQLFFREMGFKCTKVIRGAYDHTDEDAYRFAYKLETG